MMPVRLLPVAIIANEKAQSREDGMYNILMICCNNNADYASTYVNEKKINVH